MSEPESAEDAPHLPALVASSSNASPIARAGCNSDAALAIDSDETTLIPDQQVLVGRRAPELRLVRRCAATCGSTPRKHALFYGEEKYTRPTPPRQLPL
jgi:hypothetical protein